MTTSVAVVGGTVIGPDAPERSDVFIAEGRIVSVIANVGTTGAQHGRSGGRNEDGTVGAGAERSVVDASAQDDAVLVAGEMCPATGGGPGRPSRGAVWPPDGTLAGSTLSLDRAVRNLVTPAPC